MSQPSRVEVRRAVLDRPADARAVVELLDAYARDPMGGGVGLDPETQRTLPGALHALPGCRVWLAVRDETPVGVCVCFQGFSTFRARPLLNIHDLAVHADHRGQGIGRRLLDAVEAEARQIGCCRLTLEVRADNLVARGLYSRFGFGSGDPGSSAMGFWEKSL